MGIAISNIHIVNNNFAGLYQNMHLETCIIWASLSEPHIDQDNGPTWDLMVCIYLCLYYLPHVCHTLVSKIHVCHKTLRVFRYIDMIVICMIYNCMHSNEHQGRPLSAVKIIDEDRYR